MSTLLTQRAGRTCDHLLIEPLELLEEVHPTCQVLCVHENTLAPIVPAGGVIVYEPGKFCPVDGALIVVGSKCHRYGPDAAPRVDLYATQVFQLPRDPDHWYCGAVHRPRTDEQLSDMINGRRRFVASDGPWTFDAMVERTYGRIIGLYQPSALRSAGNPMRRLN